MAHDLILSGFTPRDRKRHVKQFMKMWNDPLVDECLKKFGKNAEMSYKERQAAHLEKVEEV